MKPLSCLRLLIFAILLIIFLALHYNRPPSPILQPRPPQAQHSQPSHRIPTIPHDSCHIIGTNPSAADLVQFSTRTLCLSSHLCVKPAETVYHSSNLSQTTCHVDTVDYIPTSRTLPALLHGRIRTCRESQRKFVHCAHGINLSIHQLRCPQVKPKPENLTATWFEDLSVLVPDYEYPRNIYHFVGPVADVARTVDHVEGLLERWGKDNVRRADGEGLFEGKVKLRKVNLVLQGTKHVLKEHEWKREVFKAIVKRRITKKGIDVDVTWLSDLNRTICLRNAVVMGRRGNLNVWPFPNDTDVTLDGYAVPRDAVEFKRAIYDEFNISVKLPTMEEVEQGRGEADVPPFVVAYAKRLGRPSEDGFYRIGKMRRFSVTDEKWFMDMLRNETTAAGAQLTVVTNRWGDSLKAQVEKMMKAGFVVGIHGANLVNAMFIRPFGAVMEILPNGMREECYWGGGNSGLKYLQFEAGVRLGVFESGCSPLDVWCRNDLRQRMIGLAKGDREGIRKMVREGIRHLREIRKFGDRVPVWYDEERVYYRVGKKKQFGNN